MFPKRLACVFCLGMVLPFIVVAAHAETEGVGSDRQESTQIIDLCDPWSLISFNVTPPDPSLHSVLSSLGDKYEAVHGFACGSGARSWVAERPVNDLAEMEPFYGYWIKVSEPDLVLAVSGMPMPPGTVMSLCHGWNLQSYLPDTPDTIAHALATILEHCEEVFEQACDGVHSWRSDRPPSLNDLACLRPGRGYWVKIVVDVALTYPSDGYSCDAPDPTSGEEGVAGASAVARTAPSALTPLWSDYWSVSSNAGGAPLQPGEAIIAYDPDGVRCGETVVPSSGEYLLHVYGDDPGTVEDEGAESGDIITLSLNDTCDVGIPEFWEERTSQQSDVDFCAGTSCACDCHGDPQCDGLTNVLDVVHGVNVAFRGSADIIDPSPTCPYVTTDVDCDGLTNVLDVVHLVNVAFRSADSAAEFCDPCAP